MIGITDHSITKNNMEKEPITVLLASPSYDGRFDVRFMDSLLNTVLLCKEHNIKILPYFLCFDSLIQRARNDYFRTAYNTGVDVLFFIDSDIGWNPPDFIKLVLSSHHMIGGTYRKKTDAEELYAFKALGGENNSDFKILPDQDGLMRVAGLGFGFLKLSKHCVKVLFENEPNYYVDNLESPNGPRVTKNICECVINKDNNFVSEDIIVGYKWMNMGGEVVLDTKIDLVHVGNKEYVGSVQNWLSDWRKKFEKESKTSTQQNSIISKYFVDPWPHPEDLVKQEKPITTDDLFKVL